MSQSQIIVMFRTSGVALLLTAAAAAWGQAAPPADPIDSRAPPASAGTGAPSVVEERPLLDGRPRPLVAPTVPEPPPVACYRAAQQARGDAFDCDLAVQMARDSGSRQALAAALVNRALVLAREDRLEPALADLDAAVAATPDDPAVHGNRGNLLLRMGRPEEALAAHHRAVQLAPQDPRGYYNLAFSYLALGEPEQAEREVETVRALLEHRAAVRVVDTPASDADRSR